ncbi:MAG TPA: hypothetical protein VLG49_02650 [Rhabdochlamydiaceae bacterium]|nr:hypothetical protein [Rhabdochlamydiaceae bacterium]
MVHAIPRTTAHQAVPWDPICTDDENPLKIHEFLCEVFSYLPYPSTEVSLVCKEWKVIHSDFYIARQKLRSVISLNHSEIQKWIQIIKKKFGTTFTVTEIIQKCPNLISLNLSGSLITDQELAEIAKIELTRLKSLTLRNCCELIKPEFKDFKTIEFLDLSDCKSIEELELRDLPFLKSLKSRECISLQHLEFANLPLLHNIDLSGAVFLKEAHFKGLANLYFLNLSECTLLTDPNFEGLTSLVYLYLNQCHSLDRPDFQSLSSLIQLELKECDSLTTMNCQDLPSLKMLNLIGSSNVDRNSLNDLSEDVDIIS